MNRPPEFPLPQTGSLSIAAAPRSVPRATAQQTACRARKFLLPSKRPQGRIVGGIRFFYACCDCAVHSTEELRVGEINATIRLMIRNVCTIVFLTVLSSISRPGAAQEIRTPKPP